MSADRTGTGQDDLFAGGPTGGLDDTDCSEALLRVYEYLDGELGPDDIAKIQRHLHECGPCLKQYDLDTTLKALIKRSCGCESAPQTLRTTIMNRISMTVITIEGQQG